MAMRDYQRSKVYAAENDFFVDHPEARVRERLASEEQALSICHFLVQSKPVRALLTKWGAPSDYTPRVSRVQFTRSNTASFAYPLEGRIALSSIPQRGRQAWVLCHELAHIVGYLGALRAGERIAPHGRQFVQAYVAIVEAYFGRPVAQGLRRAFVAGRVKTRGTDGEHFVSRLRAAKSRPRQFPPSPSQQIEALCAKHGLVFLRVRGWNSIRDPKSGLRSSHSPLPELLHDLRAYDRGDYCALFGHDDEKGPERAAAARQLQKVAGHVVVEYDTRCKRCGCTRTWHSVRRVQS